MSISSWNPFNSYSLDLNKKLEEVKDNFKKDLHRDLQACFYEHQKNVGVIYEKNLRRVSIGMVGLVIFCAINLFFMHFFGAFANSSVTILVINKSELLLYLSFIFLLAATANVLFRYLSIKKTNYIFRSCHVN